MDSRAWIIPFERWIIYRGVENPVIRCRKGTLNKLKARMINVFGSSFYFS